MTMLAELRKQQRIRQEELDEVDEAYYSDPTTDDPSPQGLFFTPEPKKNDFAGAGRLFEGNFIKLAQFVASRTGMSVSPNTPNGATWDIRLFGKYWNPAFHNGQPVNLKGATTPWIAKLRGLDYIVPFGAAAGTFDHNKIIEIVHNYLVGAEMHRVILLKPWDTKFEHEFNYRVQSEQFRLAASMFAGEHWRKTKLGGSFTVQLNIHKQKHILTSLSVFRGNMSLPFFGVETDPETAESTLPLYTNLPRTVGPQYPSQKAGLPTMNKYARGPLRATVMEGLEQHVFMRTKTLAGGTKRKWELQSANLVNEPLSIISPQAAQVVVASMPGHV